MRIGIIVAMDRELQLLLELLAHYEVAQHDQLTFYQSTLPSGKELVITQCGIGKVNAALGTMALLQRYNPDFIVSTGVAGGAGAGVKRLEVVASNATVYHDVYCGSDCQIGQIQGFPAIYPADERLIKVASEIENVHVGLIATGDWFVDTPQKAASILEAHPTALAFDMESCAIAQACYLRSCPYISFRIISDNPLSGNNAEEYHDFFEKLSDGSFHVLMDFLRRF